MIPSNPKLLWNISMKEAYIDGTDVHASFAVDRNKNIIISDFNGYELGKLCGRVYRINPESQTSEIFSIDGKYLKSPVIGQDGYIYITTTGYMDSKGHKLFCIYPDGSIKWEFMIDDTPTSKPVIDKYGNIYIYTEGITGTLYCINKEGKLNWANKYRSINWYEPIISKEGIIYIGLNVPQTLCALDRNGKKLWEKKIGQAWGLYPPVIDNKGIMYACISMDISTELIAIDSDGYIIWKYKPKKGSVATSPAIDKDGNLYFNINYNNTLISLSNEGKEILKVEKKGESSIPPVIGSNNMLYQQTSILCWPYTTSWIEAFTKDGAEVWKYEMGGDIQSTIIVNDNLLYALSNCCTPSKKKIESGDYEWNLYAIGC